MPAKLENLKARLDARTKPDGTALKGYAKNTQVLRAEITRLECHMRPPE